METLVDLEPMKNTGTKPRNEPRTGLQEQFTGEIAERGERPLAEVLAERQAETFPVSPAAPVFLP